MLKKVLLLTLLSLFFALTGGAVLAQTATDTPTPTPSATPTMTPTPTPTITPSGAPRTGEGGLSY